jgi:hypothetical protein
LIVTHAGAEPPGSVDSTTFPRLSTATQRAVDGQDTLVRKSLGYTAVRSLVASSACLTIHFGARALGCLDTMTSPAASVATQSLAEGHDTLVRSSMPSTFAALQECPEAGSVEVRALPSWSTATQKAAEGQETA